MAAWVAYWEVDWDEVFVHISIKIQPRTNMEPKWCIPTGISFYFQVPKLFSADLARLNPKQNWAKQWGPIYKHNRFIGSMYGIFTYIWWSKSAPRPLWSPQQLLESAHTRSGTTVNFRSKNGLTGWYPLRSLRLLQVSANKSPVPIPSSFMVN